MVPSLRAWISTSEEENTSTLALQGTPSTRECTWGVKVATKFLRLQATAAVIYTQTVALCKPHSKNA